MTLKNWKAKATQEIVDRDRALADLENELIKQQSEFDVSNEECVGHQKTIQELKSALDQVHTYIHSLFGKIRFMLDEKFLRNASKFAIFYIYKKPNFSPVFHFVLLYFFLNECPGLCRHRPWHSLGKK